MRQYCIILLILLAGSGANASAVYVNISALCDPSSLPDPISLPADRLTVVISAYHPSRATLLRRLTLAYSSIPFVASIVVLWSNPSTLPPDLRSTPKLTVLHLPSPSLNLRFLPLPTPILRSRFVAIADDDVAADPGTLSLALSLAARRPGSLHGFFARSHDLDLRSRSWIYSIHPDKYSIVLTKLMILHYEYLHKYTCWSRLSAARVVVDRERNCEDILMNFLAAMESGEGPVLVDGRVRDYGDPRNRGGGADGRLGSGDAEIERVALSARRAHRERRGWCITEFHRRLGVMPLRYSYGRVVAAIREQGLCRKGGKLVYCDQEE
ncbi:alpha-1,4-N-acetylglucosaminyltransferase EXTL3 [Apostasia shenzhenica]|uniref:Alpha-1,4-N-acetylglucosaminyltransferase EXTL3 n=1 Tax=Apostasia shenzhenica TaxID=1088818 RepID=A0A2I0AM32_9ASPA|nr:alpha-1,4-N-acetylglucosaminyltransferase EXTL3 [Apostasia shenzhenica]